MNKKKIFAAVLVVAGLLTFTACGKDKTDTEATTAATTEAASEESGSGETGMVNPWKTCTEEEAGKACSKLFKAPDGAESINWSIMSEGDDIKTGDLVQLEFTLNGNDFCARAKEGAPETEDISGMYYEWTVKEDVKLDNWSSDGKTYRSISDNEMADLITWYDKDAVISYSLSILPPYID